MGRASTVGHTRARLWIWVIIAAIVLPIAWYLGSPLFLSRTVNESFPMSTNAKVPDGMTRQQVEEEMMKASKETMAASEAMPAGQAEPKALVRGDFASADGVHKGKGTAAIYRIGGELVLRLDPFESTNGPDLYVYLSPQQAPKNSDQLHQGGALEVARLKGNIGSQNYTLPGDTDLSKYGSAVIYCKRFHVVFSTAELAAQ